MLQVVEFHWILLSFGYMCCLGHLSYLWFIKYHKIQFFFMVGLGSAYIIIVNIRGIDVNNS